MQYVSIDRVLGKFHRETSKEGVSETDLIEYVGEALDFLNVADSQEEAVAFLEVKDYQVQLPMYLNTILQVARDNSFVAPEEDSTDCSPQSFLEKYGECCGEEQINNPLDCVITDCQGKILNKEYDIAYYRPYYDLKWLYQFWCDSAYYKQNFTPVRLANHTFFNSIVAKEKCDIPYSNTDLSGDEYSIVGTTEKYLRFSFKEGRVAVAYLRTAIDINTSLPLIPDNISYLTAITYYIKWKLEEVDFDDNREGSGGKMQYYEKHWLKYCRQAKNFAKMPKTIDQFQNLLEQSHYLIPRHRRYYGFFGNLGREENRLFNDPEYRNKLTRTRYNGRR